MKIEKINDNQIKCILTLDDLTNRSLKISELAYGSEKARHLFRDMMNMARLEFGFEADQIPLMIEAVPYKECIIIIVTKVEDPDEIDTRFSNFSPTVTEHHDMLEDIISNLKKDSSSSLDTVPNLDSYSELYKSLDTAIPSSLLDINITNIFQFGSLSNLINLSKLIPDYDESNTLYKSTSHNCYLLVFNKGNLDINEYRRFFDTISEYAKPLDPTTAAANYLEEHYSPIIKDTALQTLSSI